MPNQDNWKLYYERTTNKPARDTLSKALDFFQQEDKQGGKAFDLGSGAGNDVRHLLEAGWHVFAIDNEEEAKRCFENRFSSAANASFQLASFEDITWENVDLIHAGFALPFCPHKYFSSVLENIKTHINKGGRFAGNFFGPEHTWQDLYLLSKAAVEELFEDFEVEWIEETKTTRLSTLEEEIFHHNISIIAKKR